MDSKEKFFRKIAEKRLFPFFKRSKIRTEYLVIFRIFFALLVSLILFFGNYIYSIIFITLYQFVLLLDYIDGKLARHQKRFKIRWVKIDYFFHYFVALLFLLAITLAYARSNGINYIFITGTIGSFLILISSCIGLYRFHSVRIKRRGYKGFFSSIYSYVGIDNPFGLFYFLILLNLIPLAIITHSFLYLMVFIRKLR